MPSTLHEKENLYSLKYSFSHDGKVYGDNNNSHFITQ